MIQILLLVTSIGFIVLGVKGFTANGLALSKSKSITGTPAKIVGVCCILAGIGLIPLFLLAFALYSKALSR